MRPILHSKKHIFQISQATVGQGLVVNTTFLNAIEGAPSAPQHVAEGAIVKACYVELWVNNDSGTTVGSYTVALFKDPGGNAGMLTAQMAALHDYDNKKNILFTAQGLTPPDEATMIPVMRQWYKIPKGKQRMGLSDQLKISIRNNNATAIDLNFCGLVIYKEMG